MAEEAARNAKPEDIARLDAVLAEVGGNSPRMERWVALDRRFHRAVVATLGNVVLLRTVGELFDQRINPYFVQLSRHLGATPRGGSRMRSMWPSATPLRRIIRPAPGRPCATIWSGRTSAFPGFRRDSPFASGTTRASLRVLRSARAKAPTRQDGKEPHKAAAC